MPLPRGLLIGAMLWTVAAFAATVGTRAPIQPTSGVYTPAVQAMLALLAVGGCLCWPLARLASAQPPWSPRRAALDTATVVVAFQAIHWPLHLVTQWTLAQAWAIDVLLSGWFTAAGACVALGLRTGRRTAAWGTAWVIVMVAGVGLDAWGASFPVPELLGPFAALLRVAPAVPGELHPRAAEIAAWPWIPAFCGWAAAIAAGRNSSRVARDGGSGYPA